MKNIKAESLETVHTHTHTHTHHTFTELVDSLERESYTLIKQSAVLLGKLKHKDSLIEENRVAIPLFVIKKAD